MSKTRKEVRPELGKIWARNVKLIMQVGKIRQEDIAKNAGISRQSISVLLKLGEKITTIGFAVCSTGLSRIIFKGNRDYDDRVAGLIDDLWAEVMEEYYINGV